MKSIQDSSKNASGSTFTNISRKDLESFRAKWDTLKPEQYSYTYTITGFSQNRGIYNVVCTDTCRIMDTTSNTVDRSISFDPSIDELFNRVSKLIGDQRVTYTVQFDKTYGFPASISIKWGESMGYDVSNFREIP